MIRMVSHSIAVLDTSTPTLTRPCHESFLKRTPCHHRQQLLLSRSSKVNFSKACVMSWLTDTRKRSPHVCRYDQRRNLCKS